jgi:biotin synthase
MNEILDRIEAGQAVGTDALAKLLQCEQPEEIDRLHAAAYEVKRGTVGATVHFRGIIEFSNRCAKDCFYCGIRRSNSEVPRYTMDEDDIVSAAAWAHESRYGSVVLQAGERQDAGFVGLVERVLRRIKEVSSGALGVTLSLGEQSADTYRRWFDAGAHRYLLRIETSNARLYGELHPQDHEFETRCRSLAELRAAGYQVGTGVMIGLPGQDSEDLARDIEFFRDMDVDMIGMGPYIPHGQTPMAQNADGFDTERQLLKALNMIAVTRLCLPDINIAATTALQALDPQGRERGLQAGANIIMPNVTDTRFRTAYQLYDNKPCTDENADMCRGCLAGRIAGIGETIGYGAWGDSPRFARRAGEGARMQAGGDAAT